MSASPPPARPARHGTDAAVLGFLVICCLGLPAFVASRVGALWIPHNDSWAHSRIAASLAAGELQFVGFNRASMVGMMAPLGPGAGSIVLQHLFVIVCGAVVLAATYSFARFRMEPVRAALVAATVGTAPGFALLSTSYMTDVPMMAGIAGALYFGARFLRSGHALSLVAALAAAVWGVTVREQALAALAAVIFAAWVGRPDRRRWVALGALVAVGMVTLFEVWRRSQPGDDPPEVDPSVGGAIRALLMGGLSLLFVCAPVALAAAQRPRFRRAWAVGTGAGLLAATLVAVLGSGALLGNYLAPEGAYLAMSHGSRRTLPSWLMWSAALVATVAAAVVGSRFGDTLRGPVILQKGHDAPWLRSPEFLAAVFTTIYLAGIALQTASGQPMFERYLYPLIGPLGVMLLGGNMRASLLRGALGLAAVLAVTVPLTLHTWASTGKVWKAAEGLVADGLDPKDIDAGFAWVGYHAQTPLGSADPAPENVGFWGGQFADTRQCTVVSMGEPTVGVGLTERLPYSKYVVTGTDQVVIERLPECR